jgi:hypothetical protein
MRVLVAVGKEYLLRITIKNILFPPCMRGLSPHNYAGKALHREDPQKMFKALLLLILKLSLQALVKLHGATATH